mgnify:CR=1 FL=1|tara:strand:- start:28781 stop:28954 length:174 start_codon:yes stop_codon:yes gene_type:complete
MNEYYCDVTVCWSGNNYTAKNKEEYIQGVKDGFLEEYGIVLTDKEISNIKEENVDER